MGWILNFDHIMMALTTKQPTVTTASATAGICRTDKDC